MTEERTHAAISRYIKYQYPWAIFNTDLSGLKLTLGQARKICGLRSSKSFPDLMIYEQRREFAALFIEIKNEGVKIYRKDGEMVADKHIREQAEMLKHLENRGYCARFAIGFDEAQLLIDWYLKKLKK